MKLHKHLRKVYSYIFIFISILTLLGCQKSKYKIQEIDQKSYISDFELLQENPTNKNSIRITSPKAIIDPIKNDIEIFTSKIELLNKSNIELLVKSGNSTLNNALNIIRVFNNVNITFLEAQDYYIKTDSFNWDLNNSNILLDSPLDINFDTTKIISSGGSYNLNTDILSLNNNKLNRSIFNNIGIEKYQIEIISDNIEWLKNNNTLVFQSNNKQVETYINFLSIK
ncbi:LPS export ABC transporter periplasmic protein LptC [Prochlorococcus marinus]|uniref:LPS export ABC transporter periplasmic protein LptC n=1 Tax=Prochlorococcus marinus XMU1408 TaxID=2213228 RepID=A0A318R5S2_PROMR|nr:LPS export ABC transporter periplasmic protein LptC [Prochlorococcus marinus]MBW3041972.1 LPS export ABC transporter periplasmic protein LptC [Prochlorococcus marinus str. XMU1408]PYE03098.1 LPS export ABC transporter periplasmic protein LptC [Prochlorococcus marinus XMU1408]